MPGAPAHEPIYTVTHLDGSTTTIDLTVPVGYQDLGFTLTSEVGGRRTRATVGVYHTGEIGLFCQLLTAARTHAQLGLVDRVSREVAALTEGLEPTLEAQHRLDDLDVQWLRARQPTERVRYPGTARDESLVVDTTGPLIRLTLLTADATTVTADWPAEQADSLLAGMIWRTHHQPDEPFSWLSRTPTAVFETLLAATDESGPGGRGVAT